MASTLTTNFLFEEGRNLGGPDSSTRRFIKVVLYHILIFFPIEPILISIVIYLTLFQHPIFLSNIANWTEPKEYTEIYWQVTVLVWRILFEYYARPVKNVP
jgi:hypothetical protein